MIRFVIAGIRDRLAGAIRYSQPLSVTYNAALAFADTVTSTEKLPAWTGPVFSLEQLQTMSVMELDT